MLFKSVRAGDEIILATSAGRGAGSGFTYTLVEVEAVKSSLIVVDGYKFNLKDGKGRTVPHHILPATPANRQEYLGEETGADPVDRSPAASEFSAVDDKLRGLARDALRVIREETEPAQDDDVIELLGVEALAAFCRHWRRLNGGRR